MRLEEAKRLLRGSSLTVAEIARRTGYCNPAYLVNVFRDATGLSPKKCAILACNSRRALPAPAGDNYLCPPAPRLSGSTGIRRGIPADSMECQ